MSRPRDAVIRWASVSDIDDIIEMCAEHALVERASYTPDGKRERLIKHLFSDPPRAYCLVAEDGAGGLVGYATFSEEFSTWDADTFIHVDCLYLRTSARNGRLGWQLGKRVAEEALKRGARNMQFQTPTFNTPAIRLYEAMGAHKKEKYRFYADDKDMSRFVRCGTPAAGASNT